MTAKPYYESDGGPTAGIWSPRSHYVIDPRLDCFDPRYRTDFESKRDAVEYLKDLLAMICPVCGKSTITVTCEKCGANADDS
jgi:hypothetical protein